MEWMRTVRPRCLKIVPWRVSTMCAIFLFSYDSWVNPNLLAAFRRCAARYGCVLPRTVYFPLLEDLHVRIVLGPVSLDTFVLQRHGKG